MWKYQDVKLPRMMNNKSVVTKNVALLILLYKKNQIRLKLLSQDYIYSNEPTHL